MHIQEYYRKNIITDIQMQLNNTGIQLFITNYNHLLEQLYANTNETYMVILN